MRNYIIFYAAIIVFVVGGIKLTSYVIERGKQKELDKINFHQNINDLLVSGGKVLPAEAVNKNIVIYTTYINNDTTRAIYLKLNELNSKFSDNTAFYLYLRFSEKESTDNFFKKIKVEPVFKIISEPRELYNYIQSLSRYFYAKGESNKIAYADPIAIVISKKGEIKLYKTGKDKDIMTQIETALK